MPSPFFAILLCCCRRPRAHPRDAESTAIPNETSPLLAPSRPAPVVVDPTLSERLAGIVRAKEGKMVSVSAPAPFTIVNAQSPLPLDPSSPAAAAPTNGTTTISRRPPVLTMTPANARSQGSNLHLNLYADTRGSSPAGSRASSQRRPQSAHSQTSVPASASAASGSGASGASGPSDASASERGNGKAQAQAQVNVWFGESGLEASVHEEMPPSPSPLPLPLPVPLPPPSTQEHGHDTRGITVSWGDV
ncbi:hypothetical protein DFH09DRAFT_1396701 [Mycena vulgaris]|nr:hypothetical protein DFH09DRAFT_1396701 [Mycena vulgaris]